MKSVLGAAILLAGTTLASEAQAQEQSDDKGFYVELNLGQTSVSDTDLEYYDAGGTFGGTGSTDSAEGSVDLDNAISFGGALGYDFGSIRSELAISYAKNDIESLTIDRINGADITIDPDDADLICDYLEVASCSVSGNTISYDGGRIRQLSAMLNLWYDIPLGSGFTPYIGGGLGAAGFEADGEGEVKFAWQLGAGVAVQVASGVDLTANYRYRRIGETEIPYDDNSGVNVGRIKTSEFTVGARFTF